MNTRPDTYQLVHVYTGLPGHKVMRRRVVHHTWCSALSHICDPTVAVGDPMPWPQAEQLIIRQDHHTCGQCRRRRLYPDPFNDSLTEPAPADPPPPAATGAMAVHPGRYRTYRATTRDGAEESASQFHLCRECGPDRPWGTRPDVLAETWTGWVSHPGIGSAGHWSLSNRPVVTDRFRHDQWHHHPDRQRHRDAQFAETVHALFAPPAPDRRLIGYRHTGDHEMVIDGGIVTYRIPGHPDLINPTPEQLREHGIETEPVYAHEDTEQ